MSIETLRSPNGDIVVELLPDVGGRIHRIIALGHDLLRHPSDPAHHADEPFFWGSYPMVPWCNRIPDGRLDGAQLTINMDGYAIHGEAYERPWTYAGDGHMVFEGGTYGYRWPYRAEQRFIVDDRRVTIELSLTNTGTETMRGGIGFHPWFEASTPLHVRLPADTVYPNVDCLPTGPAVPVEGPTDLRTLAAPTWELDEPWSGLTDRAIELYWPEWNLGAEYSFSDAAETVVLACFERYAGVAIEPITQVPGSPEPIAPGETITLTHVLTIAPSAQ